MSTEAGERQIKAQLVLMAVGRKPNTAGLGLEEIGVKTERGRIIVNEKMETSVPGVYAIGDAIGGILLAHVASAEGEQKKQWTIEAVLNRAWKLGSPD